MTGEPRVTRFRAGIRWWSLAEVAEEVVGAGPIDERAAELLLVRPWSGRFVAMWDELAALQDDWTRTQVEVDGETSALIGPARKVRRFLAAFGPEAEATARPERSPLAIPPLPDPADVPRFVDEGVLDPLGNDETLQRSSWHAVARHAGLLARAAHERGLAIFA
ncbi:MAG: hypothetical protein QOH21_1928, partial [Acidobacteriota bacterium]|nr:hypothetical protein [Acidobacteriota bacterium]